MFGLRLGTLVLVLFNCYAVHCWLVYLVLFYGCQVVVNPGARAFHHCLPSHGWGKYNWSILFVVCSTWLMIMKWVISVLLVSLHWCPIIPTWASTLMFICLVNDACLKFVLCFPKVHENIQVYVPFLCVISMFGHDVFHNSYFNTSIRVSCAFHGSGL